MGAVSSSALRHLSVSALGSQSPTRGPHLLLVSPWHAPHADKVPRAFSGTELSTPIARDSASLAGTDEPRAEGRPGPVPGAAVFPPVGRAAAGGAGAGGLRDQPGPEGHRRLRAAGGGPCRSRTAKPRPWLADVSRIRFTFFTHTQ